MKNSSHAQGGDTPNPAKLSDLNVLSNYVGTYKNCPFPILEFEFEVSWKADKENLL